MIGNKKLLSQKCDLLESDFLLCCFCMLYFFDDGADEKCDANFGEKGPFRSLVKESGRT